MSAQFNGSTQYLQYTAPVAIAYPFTVGCWFFPLSITTSTRCIWGIANASTSGTAWDVEYDTTNGLGFWSGVNGNWAGNATTAPTAGAWHFILARGISSTNRRFSCLYPDNNITHLQSTTSSSPTNTSTVSIGVLRESTPDLYMDGYVAEFWVATSDVIPGNLAAPDSFIRYLAFKGPFSLRNFASNIIIYRSCFQSLGSDTNVFSDFYESRYSPQTWINVNNAVLGPHPPLAPDYLFPNNFSGINIV